MTKKIVAIGGDGVGPEVVNGACHVLENMELGLEIIKPFPDRMGGPVTDETREIVMQSDAVLFGAAGEPENESIGWLRFLRPWTPESLDNYVNIRPFRYFQGVRSVLKDPKGIDFLIVRENSEGMYSFLEGDLATLATAMPEFKSTTGKKLEYWRKGKFAIRIVSERGTKRIAKMACELAKSRKTKGLPSKVTIVTKSNVLGTTCRYFQQICADTIKRYSELACEHYFIDNMARRLLIYAKDLGVILTTNLFGDILSDEASELVGGLGVVPSGCVGSKVPYFEPVHGSAPRLAGKQIVNPTAAILSAKMALEYIGMCKAAENLDKAVAAVYRERKHLTYDHGGRASTMELAHAVAAKYNELT